MTAITAITNTAMTTAVTILALLYGRRHGLRR